MEAFIQPFDLSKAPLVRVGLIDVMENKHLLVFDMHHIISDGISMQILMEECIKLYQGEALAPLHIQYKDYAVWQNEFLRSEAVEKQKKYWLNRFKGDIPTLDLPTDYPRPPIQTSEGASFSVNLDESLVEKLKHLARET